MSALQRSALAPGRSRSLAGGAVGLVLGNLRLPLFVLAASSPAAGGGANIAVSGIAAATASTTHIRAGRINWRLPSRAVRTNLAVDVCVGAAGLLGHLPSAAPDYRLVLVGGVASIPGALIGARLTGRLSEQRLVQAIGAVLLVAGAAAAVQAVV
jgi:uncharacterized membrane protein YfcA